MLYICLHLLSCNPKVVRFHLKGGRELEKEMHIQTLASPAFFPNLTPSHSLRILYLSYVSGMKSEMVKNQG
ncbi:hypothetical protein F4809DRAFT_623951 [Biscogniauxia mediterranea]|nr:hypothetical protein F4809DRAFT_623951 [Biscogniauxia mediterranea]